MQSFNYFSRTVRDYFLHWCPTTHGAETQLSTNPWLLHHLSWQQKTKHNWNLVSLETIFFWLALSNWSLMFSTTSKGPAFIRCIGKVAVRKSKLQSGLKENLNSSLYQSNAGVLIKLLLLLLLNNACPQWASLLCSFNDLVDRQLAWCLA